MDNKTLDIIIENLFYIIPILHKKLLKIDSTKFGSDFNLSRLHIGIMGIIHEEKRLPISEIAKKILIPKPQMTLLINQLVGAGMVERHPDASDRRVSDIILTPKGRATLKRCGELLKTNIKEKLSFLSEAELEELSQMLFKLRNLGTRLDKHG